MWMEKLAAWLRQRAELDSLTPAEMDALAADLGMDEGTLRAVARSRPDIKLPEMLARSGVRPEQMQALPALFRDMERVCTLCEERGVCTDWLDSGATAGAEHFCPNAGALAELRAG